MIATRTTDRQFRSLLTVPLLLTSLAGCSSEIVEGDSWVHETAFDGDTTIVRTVSGSIWKENAVLEEVASIGVVDGPEEFVFGRIVAIHAHEDRIFLIDQKPMIIRMFDRESVFLGNLGNRGSGPGEYLGPAGIAVSPDDGTIFIRDAALSRINLHDRAGRYLESWHLRSGYASFDPLVMTRDGRLFSVLRLTQPERRNWIRAGMVQVTRIGAVGDTLAVPAWEHDNRIIEFSTPDGLLAMRIPLTPEVVWAMSPSGSMVSGVSDRYRIEVHHAEGGTIRIERMIDPVPLQAAEREWYRNSVTGTIRQSLPGWNWNGPELPTHKPCFDMIVPDDSGRLWVIRRGRGYLSGEDDPSGAARWKERYLADVFREDGGYLGSVDLPIRFEADIRPSITGDFLHLVIAGDSGELILKRMRLVRGS